MCTRVVALAAGSLRWGSTIDLVAAASGRGIKDIMNQIEKRKIKQTTNSEAEEAGEKNHDLWGGI